MRAGSGRNGDDAEGASRFERAERFLRLLAEAELGRRSVTQRGRRSSHDASAVIGVNRVRAAAGSLIAAGAIDEPTALSVLDSLKSALAVRLPEISAYRRDLAPWNRVPRSPGLPDGPVRLVPVGRSVPLIPGVGGEDGLLHLVTLVLAPDRTALTHVGRMQTPDDGPGVHQLLFMPGQVKVTDNHGNQYDASCSGGASGDRTWWSGEFCFPPVTAKDVWLNIAGVGGAPVSRLGLSGPDAGGYSTARPVSPVGSANATGGINGLPPLSADAPGEQLLLDCIAGDLLWSALRNSDDEQALSGLPDMIAALEAAGALRPGSPALGRLVALARRLGAGVPAGVADAAPRAEIPEAWSNVLTHSGRRDGPDGVAPVAVVLPEIEGTCFAVAGLYSSPESATLRVLAWGWQLPHPPFRRADEPFSWWVHDSEGRWHVARQSSASTWNGGHADLDITLVPPLHPAVTSLEIFLTGRHARNSVTAPLCWQTRR